MFVLPPFVEQMLERGLTGEKAGQGFYKRVKNASGESEILTLDPDTLEYRPRQSPKLGSLEAGESIADVGERIRTLFNAKDKVGQLLRETLAPALVYTARVTPEIAHSPDDVDRVMRWGFGWELGPFEIADAIGIQQVLDAADQRPNLMAAACPTCGSAVCSQGRNRSARWRRRTSGSRPADPALRQGALGSRQEERRREPRRSRRRRARVEFHSKMNAIGGDTIQMLQAGVREASHNFAALVVGNDGLHFSAGANLMLVLLEAQEENWDEIDLMVRAFQQATMALRYADVPVVVAPAGLALGGGCEIVLHGDRVQAAAETYMGLVEVGVGLIPGRRRHQGDGGARRRTRRRRAAICCRPSSARSRRSRFAKTSTSAAGRAAARLPAAGRRVHDEPRAAAVGREGACAAARARGLSAAGPEKGDPGRRRHASRRR